MSDDTDTLSPHSIRRSLSQARHENRKLKSQLARWQPIAITFIILSLFLAGVIALMLRPWEVNAPNWAIPASSAQPTGR